MSSATPILPESLKRAAVLQTGGDLISAAKLCEDILAKHDRSDAAYFGAVNLLAALQFRSGRFIEALASYDEALAVRPHSPEVLNSRANTLKALGRFEEAIAGYDSALAERPGFVKALNNRGNALIEMKRFEEALASFDAALAIRPHHTMDRNNKTMKFKPELIDALKNRAVALAALQRFEEALESCNQALARWPDHSGVLTALGLILHEMGRFEEAVASYDKALAADPNRAETHYHRARALTELDRLEEALASCDAALVCRPDFAEAFNQRGLIEKEQRRFPEAMASFSKAQKLRPDYADAYLNEVQLHLLVGDFWSAWWKRDKLSKLDASAPGPRKFPMPPWDGLEPLPLYGRTILLHGDSAGDAAYADAIQFCRYVPLLAARGARVVLEVERPLCKLVASIAGVTQVATPDDKTTAFDLHIPFSSLPWAFGTKLDTIPAMVPYVRAHTETAAEWDNRLGPRIRPRVGVIWSDDPPREKKRRCSIALAALLPLLGVNATFVCAQRNISGTDRLVLQAQPEILTFGDALSDFSEAAALLSSLDLVISVELFHGSSRWRARQTRLGAIELHA